MTISKYRHSTNKAVVTNTPAIISEKNNMALIEKLEAEWGVVYSLKVRAILRYNTYLGLILLGQNENWAGGYNATTTTYSNISEYVHSLAAQITPEKETNALDTMYYPRYLNAAPSELDTWVYLKSLPPELMLAQWKKGSTFSRTGQDGFFEQLFQHESDIYMYARDEAGEIYEVELTEALQDTCTRIESLMPGGCFLCPSRSNCLETLSNGQLSKAAPSKRINGFQRFIKRVLPDQYVPPSIVDSNNHELSADSRINLSRLSQFPPEKDIVYRLQALSKETQARKDDVRFTEEQCSKCPRNWLCGSLPRRRTFAECPGTALDDFTVTPSNYPEVIESILLLNYFTSNAWGQKYGLPTQEKEISFRRIDYAVARIIKWTEKGEKLDKYTSELIREGFIVFPKRLYHALGYLDLNCISRWNSGRNPLVEETTHIKMSAFPGLKFPSSRWVVMDPPSYRWNTQPCQGIDTAVFSTLAGIRPKKTPLKRFDTEAQRVLLALEAIKFLLIPRYWNSSGSYGHYRIQLPASCFYSKGRGRYSDLGLNPSKAIRSNPYVVIHQRFQEILNLLFSPDSYAQTEALNMLVNFGRPNDRDKTESAASKSTSSKS
tara:strand:+ start:2610 stop:4424 length:1815 start_codon:yes stop_codon:yes gene_type:complete